MLANTAVPEPAASCRIKLKLRLAWVTSSDRVHRFNSFPDFPFLATTFAMSLLEPVKRELSFFSLSETFCLQLAKVLALKTYEKISLSSLFLSELLFQDNRLGLFR